MTTDDTARSCQSTEKAYIKRLFSDAVAYDVGETMTIESLRAAIGAIEGVEERTSRFKDGQALWAGGKEIAHFDEDDVLDIRLTAPLIRARRRRAQSKPGGHPSLLGERGLARGQTDEQRRRADVCRAGHGGSSGSRHRYLWGSRHNGPGSYGQVTCDPGKTGPGKGGPSRILRACAET